MEFGAPTYSGPRRSCPKALISTQVAVTAFGPEQIPVKRSIAENFGVFNKLYTAVPSASSPNHLFTQSATSCGSTIRSDQISDHLVLRY